MKKSIPKEFIFYTLCLFFTMAIINSCVNKEKNYTNSTFLNINTETESAIDFNIVDCINESNKKTIDIASLAYINTANIHKKELLLKIKKDHQFINSELRQLTAKNLILISKPIYQLNNNLDSLKGIKAELYYTNWLKSEIDYQIKQFNIIEITSKNDDFKEFAIKSKEILEQNNAALNVNLSI